MPIAFSIEAFNISTSGLGITLILFTLWSARFLGMLAYKKINFYPLKYIIIISDIVRVFAQLSLLLFILFHDNTIFSMCLSALIYGFASSFFLPASFQIIPKITNDVNREKSNSILSILGDIYSIIGPLIGASLVIFLGFKYVLLIDSISFIIAILLYTLIKIDKKTPLDIEKNKENANENAQSLPSSNLQPLPSWSIKGLNSWFFVYICLGFLGISAPTLIMQNHSESAWALIASFIAFGSLIASTGVLSGRLKQVTWQKIHLLCLIFLPLQLITSSSNISLSLITLSAILGACATTISGIKWDTLTQSDLKETQLPRFASADQMVVNTGIPLGMVLFGIANYFSVIDIFVIVIAVSVLLSMLFIYSPAKKRACKNENT